MPLAYQVPVSAVNAAARALDLHKSKPLEGTVGMSVAEALATGTITLDIVSRMHRFFAVNSKQFVEETQLLRTEEDSAFIRSWLMYGAEAGKAWVETAYKKAVSDGLLMGDPLTELFCLPPEQIYPRLSLGAWRYEFDLDPTKAARFCEDYVRATGFNLDLRKAFGPAAEAVGNAIYRRFNTPNPFSEVVKALMAEDDDYHESALLDLAELNGSIGHVERLDETLFPKALSLGPQQVAKLIWAPFVAYFIMAVEKADGLSEYNKISFKPPLKDEQMKSTRQYNDIVSIALTYFHPSGKHYVDPTGDKIFDGIDVEVLETLRKAWMGKPIFGPATKKMLGRARRWTAKNKMAGSLFHVYNADWNKGNWKHILDGIPIDCDMRPFFEQFEKEDITPAHGIKLQQTLSDKNKKTQVEAFLQSNFPGSGLLDPEKVGETLAGKEAEEQETPMGVYSLLQADVKAVCLGAYNVKDNVVFVFENADSPGMLWSCYGLVLQEKLKSGEWKVLQGHYTMHGTSYDSTGTPDAPVASQDAKPEIQTPPAPASSGNAASIPALVAAPDDSVKSKLLMPNGNAVDEFMNAEFGPNYTKFEFVNLAYTLSSEATVKMYGVDLQTGTFVKKMSGSNAGSFFRLLLAYKIPNIEVQLTDGESGWVTTETLDDTIIVFRTDDGDLNWLADETVADVIKNGTVAIAKASQGKPSHELIPLVSTPATPMPVEPPISYKFSPGEIIVGNTPGLYLVLSSSPKGYLLHHMAVTQLAAAPMLLSLNHTHKEFHSTETFWKPHEKFEMLFPIVTDNEAHLEDAPKDWSVKKGETVETHLGQGIFMGAVKKNGTGVLVPVVGYTITTTVDGTSVTYPAFFDLAADAFVTPPVVTYEPTAPKPEPGAEDALDVPDADVNLEMCGTPEALEKILKLGNIPATKSEDASFLFSLGDVLAYGNSQRTIVGFAKTPVNKAVYVIVTENGNFNFKTTLEGNKAYGPKLKTDTDVIKKLVPKPDAKQPKFPKLNYSLSTWAKNYAKETGAIFILSPKRAPFYVGTKLAQKNYASNFVRLEGWIGTAAPVAVLSILSNKVAIYKSAAELKEFYEITYSHKTIVDMPKSTITFGKHAGSPAVMVQTPAFTIPSNMPEGWDSPVPVEHPTLDADLGGNHLSAGILAIVAPGALVTVPSGVSTASSAMMVMVHPMNNYGGYTLTFPKGTVEKGESVVKAAVRECWEETGLAIKPVAFLGDFKGNSSITRMFIGHVTGGNPATAGKETDAVTFKPLSENMKTEQWWSDLTDRDKNIALAGLEWMTKNGIPEKNVADKANVDAQVTMTSDTVSTESGTTKPAKFLPGAKIDHPKATAKQYSALLDYQANADAVKWYGEKAEQLPGIVSWKPIPAEPLVNRGFPPPGSLVKCYDAGSHAFFVEAYIQRNVVYGNVPTNYVIVLCRFLEKAGSPFGWLDILKVESPNTPSSKVTLLVKSNAFSPVVQQSVATNVSADSGEDVWDQLFKKIPFPMTTTIVNEVKSYLDDKSVVPSSFVAVKAASDGPQYATVFSTPGGSSYIAMGHLTVLAPGLAPVLIQIGIDTQGDPTCLSGEHADLKTYVPDTLATAKFSTKAPWFTHPDPVTNSLIQKVYASGGNLDVIHVKMKEFKEKWLKEAGVPYYAVASYTILQDIAACFVPGAASKIQYDAVIGCLKKRMQLTQKKGKVVVNQVVNTVSTPYPTTAYTIPAPAPVSTPTTTPAATKPSAFPPPPVIAKTASFDDEAIKAHAAHPNVSDFAFTSQTMSGGSKPNHILTGPNGTKWFFKMGLAGETNFRAHTDKAAYTLASLVKTNNVPVGILQLDGKVGSIQPVIEGSSSLGSDDYKTFSPEDMAEVLSQHVVDMFMGDHDGHGGNWLRLPNGKLAAIDRGQAFKFIVNDQADSLNPTWKAPGNFGQPVAKALLVDWTKSKLDIPSGAFKSMRLAIDKVMEISDDQIDSVVVALADGAGYTAAVEKKLRNALKSRRDSCLSDWTSVMEKLASGRGETWKWPQFGVVGYKPPDLTPKSKPNAPAVPDEEDVPLSIKVSPADLKFTKRETKDIEDAVKSGWQGKSLRIDRGAVENQEVMVRKVAYSGKDTKGSGTLIHFRISRSHAEKASEKLIGVASVVHDAGAQPLQADEDNNLWQIIKSGIGTVNQHISVTKDGVPNPETIKKVQAILPLLGSLISDTADPSGKYKGEPNEAVNQMAHVYLAYAQTIIEMAAKAKELIGQKSEMFYQYKYEPKKDAVIAPTSAPFKVFKISVGKQPASNVENGVVSMKTIDSPLAAPGGYGSFSQAQYQITITGLKDARIYFSPAEGVKSYYGQVWALFPGEPSAASLALMLKVFQDATGINMEASSDEDRQFLFWSRQGAVLQPSSKKSSIVAGSVEPNKYAELIVDPPYVKARTLYDAGMTKQALAAMKDYVASRLNDVGIGGKSVDVTPATLDKLLPPSGYDGDYTKHTYSDGTVKEAGWCRTLRIGWTRDSLNKYLGGTDKTPVLVAHVVTGSGIDAFFENAVPNNGALISTVNKPYYGVNNGGGSPSDDICSGGAPNIFCVIRKGINLCSGHLYFDPSLLLRTDVYVVGSGDTFGRPERERLLTPESWKLNGLHEKTGSSGISASYQLNVRHEIDLRQYLWAAVFSSDASMKKAKKLVKSYWGENVLFAGRTVDEVFITK